MKTQRESAKTKESLRELEVINLEKMINLVPVNNWDYDLIGRIFDRFHSRLNSFLVALSAVYQMGYIKGVQDERKRRKKAVL